MAIAYISEYKNLVTDESGRVIQVPLEPAVTQIVTFTTTTQSTAFASETRFVRIISDTVGHFVFGTDPTALTNVSPYVAADTPEFFAVPRGASYKVAFVT